jgi:hypothetical protein
MDSTGSHFSGFATSQALSPFLLCCPPSSVTLKPSLSLQHFRNIKYIFWKNGLYEMNLDPATGTMIAMTGDTLDLQYVIKVCPAIFWREAVGIAKFIRRDGGSDQGIQTEANL